MAHSYYDPKEKVLRNAYHEMLNEEQEKGKGNLTTFLEDIDLTEAVTKLKNGITSKSNSLKNIQSLLEQDITQAINHDTNKQLIEALFKLSEAIECLELAKSACKED